MSRKTVHQDENSGEDIFNQTQEPASLLVSGDQGQQPLKAKKDFVKANEERLRMMQE